MTRRLPLARAPLFFSFRSRASRGRARLARGSAARPRRSSTSTRGRLSSSSRWRTRRASHTRESAAAAPWGGSFGPRDLSRRSCLRRPHVHTPRRRRRCRSSENPNHHPRYIPVDLVRYQSLVLYGLRLFWPALFCWALFYLWGASFADCFFPILIHSRLPGARCPTRTADRPSVGV